MMIIAKPEMDQEKKITTFTSDQNQDLDDNNLDKSQDQSETVQDVVFSVNPYYGSSQDVVLEDQLKEEVSKVTFVPNPYYGD